jgi:glycine hydroxymethyltransferase
VTSGLRSGTPSITRRGFKEAEARELTGWICDVLDSLETDNSEAVIDDVKAKVLNICSSLPVYK